MSRNMDCASRAVWSRCRAHPGSDIKTSQPLKSSKSPGFCFTTRNLAPEIIHLVPEIWWLRWLRHQIFGDDKNLVMIKYEVYYIWHQKFGDKWSIWYRYHGQKSGAMINIRPHQRCCVVFFWPQRTPKHSPWALQRPNIEQKKYIAKRPEYLPFMDVHPKNISRYSIVITRIIMIIMW